MLLLKLLKTVGADALYLLLWPKHLLAKIGIVLPWWVWIIPLLVWWALVVTSSVWTGCWVVVISSQLNNIVLYPLGLS